MSRRRILFCKIRPAALRCPANVCSMRGLLFSGSSIRNQRLHPSPLLRNEVLGTYSTLYSAAAVAAKEIPSSLSTQPFLPASPHFFLLFSSSTCSSSWLATHPEGNHYDHVLEIARVLVFLETYPRPPSFPQPLASPPPPSPPPPTQPCP